MSGARDRWRDPDRRIAPLLGLLTVAARWPWRSQYLNGWDGYLFALAVEDYDVGEARPHAPGYPVYVALGKLVHLFVPDINASLVALSLVFSGVTIAFLYLLVREFASRGAALLASLLFLWTPYFVFNGVVALSYTVEAAASVLIGYLAVRARRNPTIGNRVAIAVAWAFAVGTRQSLLFYLAPLVVWSLVPDLRDLRTHIRRAIPLALISVGTALLWFIPMIVASGWSEYRRAVDFQTDGVVFGATVFQEGWLAIVKHWTVFLLMIRFDTGVIVLTVLAFALVWAARNRPPFALPSELPVFMAFWVVPTLLFHFLIFNGFGDHSRGYGLTFLPALYLAYGVLWERAIEAWLPSAARRLGLIVVTALLLLPGVGLALDSAEFVQQEVQDHDRWTESWSALPSTFPANDTAILASYSYLHAKWFFPEHVVWLYRNSDWVGQNWSVTIQSQYHRDIPTYYEAQLAGRGNVTHPIPSNIRRVILFDVQLAGENGEPNRLVDGVEVQETQLENGWRVLYVETDPSHPTIESYLKNWPWYYPSFPAYREMPRK